MHLGSYNARVTLTIAGPQDSSLDTFRRPAGEPSFLIMSFASVLIYCYTPKAVLVQHEAWTEALAKAARVFAAGYQSPMPQAPEDPMQRSLIAKVNALAADTWDVTGFAAGASPDGFPLVSVRVGALTLQCRDLEAVEDLQRVWNDALSLAPTVWQPVRPGRLTIGET